MATPNVEVRMNQGVQAFGMSITLGLLASSEVNYWVNRLAQFIGGPVDNKAIGGTGFPSMVLQSNQFSPYSPQRTKLVVIDGPLNDVRQVGPAAIPITGPSLDAMLSNAFCGYMRSASHTATQVTRYGSWQSLGSSYGGRSCCPSFGGLSPMYTNDPNAYINFAFSGPVVALHGFMPEAHDWADLAICIDGNDWGCTEWEGKARAGANKQSVALVIDELGDGQHTLKVSRKTGCTGPAVVDCIQTPNRSGTPPVLLGLVPDIKDWTYGGAIGTWDDAQEVNDIISAVADRWYGYGYPIADVEILLNDYDFAPDGVHLTDRGQLNWALPYMGRIHVTPNAY